MHEISQVDGINEAMFAGVPAWHGLGQVIENAPSSRGAIKMAHLDWRVEKLPAAAIETLDDGDKEIQKIHLSDEWFSIVRSDTKKILGMVKGRYSILQNDESFAFLDSLVESDDLRYESAGALRFGKKVWLLARMPHVDQVAEGDSVKRYLLFSNSHDGSCAVNCLPTSVRVVCANTLAHAMSKKNKGEGISIRHTGDMTSKVEAAREALAASSKEFGRVLEIERTLAAKRITGKQFSAFLHELYPEPSKKNDDVGKEGRGWTMWDNKTIAIQKNYLEHPTNQLPSMARTGWAALNAVTFVVDHEGNSKQGNQSASKAESRMQSIIWGAGAEVKRKAFDVAAGMFA